MICQGCGKDRLQVNFLCSDPYYICVVCVLKRNNEADGNFEMFKNPNLKKGYKDEVLHGASESY